MSYFTCLEAQNLDKYFTFARFWGRKGSRMQNQSYFTCLEGSGRLKVSYCTRLEAQNADKYITFVRFWDGRFREAQLAVFYVSGRLWEAQCVVFYLLGSSTRR